MYPIEKGFPIPASRVNAIYPFRQMKVGDSFYVPARPEERPCGTAQRVKQAIRKAKCVRRGLNFTARTDGGGVRVWRIE